MFEMELIMFFINFDLESLKKFKWMKRKRKISQFKVESQQTLSKRDKNQYLKNFNFQKME